MRRFGIAVVVISLAAVLCGTPGVVQADPLPATIIVTPDAELVDGQVVDIEGVGWQPGHQIGFCQSVIVDPPGPENCDSGLYTQVTADDAGGFSSTLTVHSSIFVPALGQQVDCTDSSQPCVVGAADGADIAGTVAIAPISFVLTVPRPPTGASATAGAGEATVSWAAPVSDGGSALTGYWVTAYDGFFPVRLFTFDASSTTRVVTGLTNGTRYWFRVRALNALGKSAFSNPTRLVTPLMTVPGAPTDASATAGDGGATVSWVAPVSDGGSALTGYWVTAYEGFFPVRLFTFDASSTTRVVTGLTNGTRYWFRVRALNALGKSAFSNPTRLVTPVP